MVGDPSGLVPRRIAIEATGNPGLVYAALGGLSLLIPLFFFTFTAIGHAERYIPADTKEVFPLERRPRVEPAGRELIFAFP